MLSSVPIRAFTFILLFGTLPLFSQEEKDLTLGIETISGLRSSYILRGFQLAGSTVEIQAATEVALDQGYLLGVAAWNVTESSGDFAETGFGVSLKRAFEDITLTASLDYRLFSESLFQDGIDLGLEAQWAIDDHWDLTAKAHYDSAAEGAYFALEGGWSLPLSEDLFASITSGVSAVSNYYERDGINDFYGRLTLTYNVNSFLSLSPFAGYSIGIPNDATDEVFAGVWLAVSF